MTKSKMRVYELAKELDMQNKELVDWLQAHGYEEIKSHSSSLDADQAQAVIEKIMAERNPQPAAIPPQGFVVRRRRAAVAPSAPAESAQPAQPEPAQEEAPAPQPPSVETEAPAPVVVEAAEAAPAPVEAREEPSQVEEAPAAPAPAPAPTEEPEKKVAEAPAKPAQPPAQPEVPTPKIPGIKGPYVPGQEGVDPRTLQPTPTQAVVISRPLIPIRRVTPPPSPARRPPAAPGKKIGELREVRVVPDQMGRGRDFVEVSRERAKPKKGGARPTEPAAPPSKHELMAMATGRMAAFPVRPRKKKPAKKGAKTLITTPKESKRVIKIEESITVADLSQRLGVKATELIRKLMRMGVMANINQALDLDTAQILAADYDYTVEKAGFDETELLGVAEDRPEDLEPRPPVVTIMGHVDHGKTTLLDAIRKSRVAAGEAGGITQHIGAYSVQTSKGPVTFLDTPGHEAFTAMRARGAQVTDVVVLVVAADDGVMPQTVESINHARAAEVPIVVAITKADKPEGNIDRVKQQLAEHELIPEEWGGDTLVVPVSAKTGENLETLLESIALQSEILELQANPKKAAHGVVIESKLEKGRGPVATVLVQGGTLRRGDAVVTGTFFGRLRALHDHTGKMVNEVGPGYAVEIVGLSGVPSPGEEFHVVKDIKVAEEIAKNREAQERKKAAAQAGPSKVSLEELFAKVREDGGKELRVVIKADVHGSSEALAHALEQLSTQKVRVKIIHKGVGAITESDVNLAKASEAMIVGFNVRPESKAKELARSYGIDIRSYNVIYDAVEDVRAAMEGMLDVITREKVIGQVEVRAIFSVPRYGQVAGSYVTDGKVTRAAHARVRRGRKVVFEGKIASLRRFKDDVREVAQGFECGIALEGFDAFEVGDTIEVYELEQIRQTL